jgi:hypothetical protein
MIGSRHIIRSFLPALFIIMTLSGSGQKVKLKHLTTFDDKFIHFGFTLGLNMLDFNVRNYLPIGDSPGFYPTHWDLDPNQIDYGDTVRAILSRVLP